MAADVEAFAGTLIVGGGPAGAAAALTLARAGHRAMLWEQEKFPHHKICSGLLNAGAQAELAALGIDLDAWGAPHAERLRIITPAHVHKMRLGMRVRSLSRRCLDAALLERAAAEGIDVRRGVAARTIGDDGVVMTNPGGVRPAALVVATGGVGVPGMATPPPPRDDRTAFHMLYRLQPAQRAELSGHVERLLFDGGWLMLHMVERAAASLMLVVGTVRLTVADGSFSRLLENLLGELPHLARRLSGAVRLADQPAVRRGLPRKYVYRPPVANAPMPDAALWRAGDRAATMPPELSAGVALALASGRLAARSVLMGETPVMLGRRHQRKFGFALARHAAAARLMTTGAHGGSWLRLAATAGVATLLTREGRYG